MWDKGDPHEVHVYSLRGHHIHSLRLEDRYGGVFSPTFGKALPIINDELVVADRTNKRFSIYSLAGKLLRSVRCKEISTDKVSLCHAGGDSIIITNCHASPELFKFNLASGAVEWRSNSVKQSGAVAMVNKEYALVTEWNSHSQVKVFVIIQMTGEVILDVL